MTTATQHRPRRIGRAVSLALAASLALFAFSPGAALAAGGVTATQTANTNCDAGVFEWALGLTGFTAGNSVVLETTFGFDYRAEPVAITGDPTVVTWSFTGTSSDTLGITVYDGSWNVVATGSATPSCAPPAPAAPTTKADCDGTGWAAFPGMRNKGDCVKTVMKGGK